MDKNAKVYNVGLLSRPMSSASISPYLDLLIPTVERCQK